MEETKPPEQVRVDIGELLYEMKVAYEKMGVKNSHKRLLVTAGSVIITLAEENHVLKADIEKGKAEPPSLVSLT